MDDVLIPYQYLKVKHQDLPVEVSHEEVQIAANAAQPKMTEIMREIIRRS